MSSGYNGSSETWRCQVVEACEERREGEKEGGGVRLSMRLARELPAFWERVLVRPAGVDSGF